MSVFVGGLSRLGLTRCHSWRSAPLKQEATPVNDDLPGRPLNIFREGRLGEGGDGLQHSKVHVAWLSRRLRLCRRERRDLWLNRRRDPLALQVLDKLARDGIRDPLTLRRSGDLHPFQQPVPDLIGDAAHCSAIPFPLVD
jgi:hypothetical protein